MSENESQTGPRKRRAKRMLSPPQKYEIWLLCGRIGATMWTAGPRDRATMRRPLLRQPGPRPRGHLGSELVRIVTGLRGR